MSTHHPNGIDDGSDESVGETVKRHATETIDGIKEASAAAQERGVETVSKTIDQGARFVRENPGVALAGAVGVGVLIGLVLRSRE